MKYTNWICTLFLAIGATYASGQEYSMDLSSGKLSIVGVNEVIIEGHSGSKVIISTEGHDEDEEANERAAGLRAINASGASDNTGIGLSVTKTTGGATVQQISSNNEQVYVVKVPAGVSVYYEHSTSNSEDLVIRKLSNEVEVSTVYGDVTLENASGPVAINTVYGDINATFSSLSSASSIHSTYGFVDVTVPASAKASFRLKTTYGSMFTDLDLKFESEDEGMKKLSSKQSVATLNGGGTEFSIQATYDDIYLRKS